jgi:hypothetical protein
MLWKLVHSTFAPTYALTKGDSFNVTLGTRESQYLVFRVTNFLLF